MLIEEKDTNMDDVSCCRYSWI